MGILITTFGLIWLLLITAGIQFQKAKDDTMLTILVQDTVAASAESLRTTLLTRSTKEYRKFVPAPPNKNREGKHSKKLNIAPIISDSDLDMSDAALYILHRLLPQLYTQKTCLRGYDENVLTRLTEQVMKDAKHHHTIKKQLDHAKQLANLELEIEDLQPLFYKVMKGTIRYSEKKAALQEDEYYSLLSFIAMENTATILSIHKAPRELLLALFPDEKIVDDLIHERKIAAKEKDKMKRLSLKEKIQAKFSSYLPEEVPSHFIDFDVTVPSDDEEEEEEEEEEDEE